MYIYFFGGGVVKIRNGQGVKDSANNERKRGNKKGRRRKMRMKKAERGGGVGG